MAVRLSSDIRGRYDARVGLTRMVSSSNIQCSCDLHSQSRGWYFLALIFTFTSWLLFHNTTTSNNQTTTSNLDLILTRYLNRRIVNLSAFLRNYSSRCRTGSSTTRRWRDLALFTFQSPPQRYFATLCTKIIYSDFRFITAHS
jgi:hypothetical protein